MTRIGSLATGYGGLDLAIESVIPGASLAWVADIEPGPRKILAHRFPDVPNLGDITAVDWSALEPVDIICGGTPCQDLSTAGRRAGMREGTRSNLWVAMREAIATIRPQLVIWENVDGAHSAHAASDLEPCAGCVGDPGGRTALRALGRVLGDLASLGYDAEWVSLRAADVGACHGRRRVFVAAHPRGEHSLERGLAAPGQATDGRSLGEPARRGRAPSLATGRQSWSDGFEDASDASSSTSMSDAWATPAAHTAGAGSTADAPLLPTPRATRGGSATEAVSLLPTPSAADGLGGHERRGGARGDELLLKGLAKDAERWGDYAPAIARHAQALGRPAPAPTEIGPKGNPRLSAFAVEWMMCLPAGWVTDVPNLTRNEQLRLLGNGVVPPQAIAALRWLLDMSRLEVAA